MKLKLTASGGKTSITQIPEFSLSYYFLFMLQKLPSDSKCTITFKIMNTSSFFPCHMWGAKNDEVFPNSE